MSSLLSDGTNQQDDEEQPQPPQQPDPMSNTGWGLGGFGQPAPTPAAQQQATANIQQQAAAQPPVMDLSGPGSLADRAQNFIQSNGGPDPLARTGWQDFNYGMGAPGRAVSQIPYFNQQPQILQQGEQAAANAAPWVLATGGGGLIAKAGQIGTLAVGQDVDQLLQQGNPSIPFTGLNYRDLNTPFGGPVGIASGFVAPAVGDRLEGALGGVARPEVAPEVPTPPAAELPRPVEPSPAPTEPIVGTPTYPASPIFQNADHQAGFYQGALDRQEQPSWRDIPPEFQSRGVGDTDFTQGRKEGFMGMQPGTLMNPTGAGQMTMDEAMQGISPVQVQANLARPGGTADFQAQNPNVNPSGANVYNNGAPRATPAQAINVQNAAQDAWMKQPGNNPYRPPSGGAPRTPTAAAAAPAYDLLSLAKDTAGIPMSLKVDAHIPFLRQGAASMFADPSASFAGLQAAAKSFVSEEGAEAASQAIHDLPYASLAKEVGLFESKAGLNVPPGMRESWQEFRSGQSPIAKLGNAIPFSSNTERSYVAEMNTVRALRFNGVAQSMIDAGLNPGKDMQAFKNLANVINNQTGHGAVGQGPMPLFFSMRALSGRVGMFTDLIPRPGQWNPLTPGAYQEAIKGGISQVLLGGSLLGLASVAGATIDKTDGLPVAHWRSGLGTQTFDPWAGQNAVVKLVAHSIDAAKSAPSPNDAIDSIGKVFLQFGRGELGPLQSAVTDQILGKDYFGNPLPDAKDRAINLLAPFWAQAVYEGVRDQGLIGAAHALPSFLGGSVSETAHAGFGGAYANAPSDTLAKSFPDSPLLQQALNGKDWSELLPNEKKGISATLSQSDPQLAQQIQDQSRATNPASAAHADAITGFQDRKASAENYLLDQYNAGKMDAGSVKNAFHIVESDYYNSKTKADADPAYQAELAKFKESGQDPSAAQKYVDAYYQISQHYAADKAERQSQEAKYIQWVQSQDPQMAVRLVAAIQPKNQTELERMYYSGALNGVR